MRPSIRKSIASKLLIVVLVLYATVTLCVTSAHVLMEYHYHKNNIKNGLTHIQQAFEGGLSDSLWKMDQEALSAAVKGSLKIPSVIGIKVTNAEEKLVAVGGIFDKKTTLEDQKITVNILGFEPEAISFKPHKYKWELFSHSFTLHHNGTNDDFLLGQATLYSSAASIFTNMKLQLLLLILNVLFTVITFGVSLIWAVRHYLGTPLGKLANAAKNVNLDNLSSFSAGIKPPKGSELQLLEESFTTMIHDLSQSVEERKATEEELEEALIESEDLRHQAEEANKLKTAFLASLGHEIRTPMNGILGFANLLQDEDLTGEEQEEYIHTIKKSGKRMINIINDLIDISKIESGQIYLSKEKTSANSLLLDLYNFFKAQAAAKNLDFSFSRSLPEDESFLEIDKLKIYQVLTNLLSNALKFTEKGKICFGYTKKENALEFYVKDTGIGIEPTLHNIIFERFRQIETDYAKEHEGSGLGLAISQAFVKAHNGEIKLESELGKGSYFYFSLPYQKPSKNS